MVARQESRVACSVWHQVVDPAGHMTALRLMHGQQHQQRRADIRQQCSFDSDTAYPARTFRSVSASNSCISFLEKPSLTLSSILTGISALSLAMNVLPSRVM